MRAQTGVFVAILIGVVSLGLGTNAMYAQRGAASGDPLPSWNEGAAKKSIVDFVTRVTTEGSPDFVKLPERIAVFDHDGTLWCEQPTFAQLAFVVDRIKALAAEHPEWSTTEPYKSLLAGEFQIVEQQGERSLMRIMASIHQGTSADDFNEIVSDWISTARHPETGRLYTEMAYQPMLELIGFLRENNFKVFIVCGGGLDFLRPWSQRVYGIPNQQVIGSRVKLKYEIKDGTPVLLKLPEIDLVDEGPGKPASIQQVTGRRPILAVGNSDGDFEMLEWVTAGRGTRLGLLVHHTDDAREWSYDRDARVGRLDRALDAAAQRGWVIADMKSDWKTVFADTEKQTKKVGAR
jgi:phosphoserine phosphatase